MKKTILDIRTYIRAALLYLVAGVVLFSAGLAVCIFLTNRVIYDLATKKIDSDLEYWSDSVEGCMNAIEMDARSRLTMTGDSSLVLNKEYFGDFGIQNYAFSDYAWETFGWICGQRVGIQEKYQDTMNKLWNRGLYSYVSYIGEGYELFGGDTTFRNEDWYKCTLESGKPRRSSVFYEPRSGLAVLDLCFLIFDKAGNAAGVLGFDVSLESIYKACSVFKTSLDSKVYLYDRAAGFICSSDSVVSSVTESDMGEYAFLKGLYGSMPDSSGRGTYRFVDSDGSRCSAVYTKSGSSGLITIITMRDETLYSAVSHLYRILAWIMLTVLVLLGGSFVFVARHIRRMSNNVAKVDRELEIAFKIQDGLLPKAYPAFPGCASIDIFGSVAPARYVGGDFYDYFISGGKLFFCVGDVSDKGVPAALLMSETVSLLRNISKHSSDVVHIMTELNEALIRGGHDMFCSMFLGAMDMGDGTVDFCNAGHNPPIAVRRNPDGTYGCGYVEMIHNIPLGVFTGYEYRGESMLLAPGDSIFLYTDGVTEARDESGAFYGDAATLDSVKEIFNSDAVSGQWPRMTRFAVSAMLERLESFVGEAEQNDDITMLILSHLNIKEA